MAKTYLTVVVFLAAVLWACLEGKGIPVLGVVTMIPSLLAAGVQIIFHTDLVGFTQQHKEMYAHATDVDGNYSAVTIHYYSVMGDFLQTTLGEYWHWVPQKRGLSRDQNYDDFNMRVSKELDLQPGQTLCEMGCGLCRTGRDIAKKAGAKFIGVTLSPREVELGQRELEADGHGAWAKIIQGDYKDMPMDDGSCDAVFAIYTLKYSQAGTTLNKAFAEVARILRPDGKFGSYEILKAATHDESNATHKEWTDRISYHTGMPPLSSVQNFREDPPKFGLKLLVEDNYENHADRAPSYAGYPFSIADPPTFWVGLLSFFEDIGVKEGFRGFAENFVKHPVEDFVASIREGVLASSTLFIYQKETQHA